MEANSGPSVGQMTIRELGLGSGVDASKDVCTRFAIKLITVQKF